MLDRPYDIDTFGELPETERDRLIGLWGVLHGLALEINSHLPFIEDHESLVVGQVMNAASTMDAIGR